MWKSVDNRSFSHVFPGSCWEAADGSAASPHSSPPDRSPRSSTSAWLAGGFGATLPHIHSPYYDYVF